MSDHAETDIARMRELHADLDQAVLDAYGWSDLKLAHGLHAFRKMQRWTVSPSVRVELLDRLLEENHLRAKTLHPDHSLGSMGEGAGDDDGLLFA